MKFAAMNQIPMKLNFRAILLSALLVFGIVSCASETTKSPNPSEENGTTVAQAESGSFQITLQNVSEGFEKTFTGELSDKEGPETQRLLDWMLYFHQKNPTDFPLETKEVTGIGVFVEAMFGKKNGEEGGKYWMYCVNDTSSPVGASERILRKGDHVNWYYTLPKELPCKKLGE